MSWERREKNCLGDVKRVYRHSGFTEKDVYDSLPNVKYTVEYLRADQVEAEERSHLRGSEIEPYELYDEYETNSLGLALREIIFRNKEVETLEIELAAYKEFLNSVPGGTKMFKEWREGVERE